MFQPSQTDVRRFFCATYIRQRAGAPLEPMQALAARWVDEHPEYHAELADEAAALAAVYTVEEGRTNPFLHLSMHLSIHEQVAIDQPTGIRQAAQLAARGPPRGDGLPGRDDLGQPAQRPAARRPGLPGGGAPPRHVLKAA